MTVNKIRATSVPVEDSVRGGSTQQAQYPSGEKVRAREGNHIVTLRPAMSPDMEKVSDSGHVKSIAIERK